MARRVFDSRVASGYSARYGASHPHDLVRRAAERGIQTLALTDRDTVSGAVRFAKAATSTGIRPVFGVDVAVAPHTPARPGSTPRPRTPARGGAHVVEPPLRITLLARNAAGWARLCRLVSAAHADAAEAPPVVSWETLRRYADEDLLVLLGPVSEPVRALSAGRPDLAERLIAPWREVAGANLRLETVCWGVPGTGPGSLRLAARTVGLADQLGVRVEQLDYELGVIGKLEYEAYFLAVAQVVADVRAMGIRVAARGSGAGSMVNHALFVATANPLDHDLLFERFLSERRSSLPDIDVDVKSARRLEVYDRIIERFGPARVAVTGMPETYRARHALRDTGLAMGIAQQVVDRIAKSFPHIRACDIRDALATLPELKQLAAEASSFGPLWELAEGLDKLPRGIAMHPCGVILSNATLLDRLPVQPTPGGQYPMVQADKEDVDSLGVDAVAVGSVSR